MRPRSSAWPDASAWITANTTQLKEDLEALGTIFRRFGRRAERLRVAAGRPMYVAVFGASQAGKSYLVSSLATAPGRPLLAAYGAERVNFLTALNPQGGKESTGLVSRFTLRAAPAPADNPVPLRLLSQTDVVKILANACLEDFKVQDFVPPGGEAVRALFARLEAQAGPSDGLTADDIEELRGYFALHFSGHALLQALGPA